MYILGMMYEYNENLRRLDQVLVTNREYDKVLAFKMAVAKKNFNNLKSKRPQNPKEPPALKQEDDDKKNT